MSTIRCRRAFSILPLLGAIVALSPAGAREWKDTTGKFSVEAEGRQERFELQSFGPRVDIDRL